MAVNLDIETYRNGDIIPQVTDPAIWAALKTGAWCFYNNDVANGVKYGKLYNWYAVNDSRGLAPKGWHIPSVAEWTILSTLLGGEDVAGGKLKEVGTIGTNKNWRSPNTNATNESGFTALPGGYRLYDGGFNDVVSSGYWWSHTEFNSSDAWGRNLNYLAGYLIEVSTNKGGGFSVRCIKD